MESTDRATRLRGKVGADGMIGCSSCLRLSRTCEQVYIAKIKAWQWRCRSCRERSAAKQYARKA